MPDFETFQFSAPIPGQSLTTEPKGRPWETPAKYSDPEDALEYYVSQISIPERTIIKPRTDDKFIVATGSPDKEPRSIIVLLNNVL